MAEKSNVMILKEFFGYRTNSDGTTQTLQQFAAEMNALTPEAKEQLATGIRDGSLTY